MNSLLTLNERPKLQPEFASFTGVDYRDSVLRCRARHSHRLPLTRLGHRPHSVAPETNRCLFKAPKIARETFLACIRVCHARYKWGLFCFCGCRLIARHFTYLLLARLPPLPPVIHLEAVIGWRKATFDAGPPGHGWDVEMKQACLCRTSCVAL